MKNLRRVAGAALMTMCFALPANATTFDFFWTGDPLLDPNIVSSEDTAAVARGTLDIDVANGAAFTRDDISNIDIIAFGDNFVGFQLKSIFMNFGVGTVAADGSTASITVLNLIEDTAMTDNSLGCDTNNCDNSVINLRFQGFVTAGSLLTTYTSQSAAQAAFRLTAQSSIVPVPAALPLLGSGLALLGMMGWRRKKVAS